jgi:hypothetical protein
MGCRFVRDWRKTDEEKPGLTVWHEGQLYKAKSRLAALGHQDPDLMAKLKKMALASPTVGHATLRMGLQLAATLKLDVDLADIATAFLNSEEFGEDQEPLFAEQPPGGIRGVPPGVLLRIRKPFYGFNDAPEAWRKKLSAALRDVGYVALECDPCAFVLRVNGAIESLILVHVDDMLLAGRGEHHLAAMKALQEKFKFRSWRHQKGPFLGMILTQNRDHSITLRNPEYGDKLRPIRFAKDGADGDLASPEQVSAMRGALGTLQWMATQWRPDLAAQTSLALQTMPSPSQGDLKKVNAAIRRARLDKDLEIKVASIPLESLMLYGHTDSSLGNAPRKGTQAGYVIAGGERHIAKGEYGNWGALVWKSSRLRRTVASSLAAEGQAALNCARELDWCQLLFLEMMFGADVLTKRERYVDQLPMTLIMDCKSLYDQLTGPTLSAARDRENQQDVVILRGLLSRLHVDPRWAPGLRQVADAMTKDQAEAHDTLRVALKSCKFCLGREEDALEERAKEKASRLARGQENAKKNIEKNKEKHWAENAKNNIAKHREEEQTKALDQDDSYDQDLTDLAATELRA